MPPPAPERLQRAMEILYAGLTRLAEGFERLDPEVRASYELDEVGILPDLRQGGYTVHTEDPVLPRFVLELRCEGSHTLRHVVAKVGEREQLRQRLEELGLRFSIDDIGTWRFGFSIAPFVPVRLEFTPAPNGKFIQLTVFNLNRLGTELFSIQAGQVCDDLINEMGKLILRRENRFAQMCGGWVSEEARERLRRRVQHRKLERERVTQAMREDDRHQERGLKNLLFGQHDTADHGRHPGGHIAPTLVSSASNEGWVEWDGDLDPAPSGDVPAADLTAEAVASLARKPDNTGASGTPQHAWIITADVRCGDSSASVGKRGPTGSMGATPTPRILGSGEHFQLKDRTGRVLYSGMISGSYQGLEPLLEFGLDHDCCVIEYQRAGHWIRVRPDD